MQKKISIILIAIIFGAMLVFANSKGFLDSAKSAVGVVTAPAGSFLTGSGGGIINLGKSLLNLGKLQEENADSSEKNNQLPAE